MSHVEMESDRVTTCIDWWKSQPVRACNENTRALHVCM
jgi:hypothetical protein